VFDLAECAFDDAVEGAVEIAEELDPVGVLLLDVVELELHAGGEADVHDLGDGLDQLVGDDGPEHGREKAAVLLGDVFAVLDRLDDAGVGGRAPMPRRSSSSPSSLR